MYNKKHIDINTFLTINTTETKKTVFPGKTKEILL
jgi:hypothetical protein